MGRFDAAKGGEEPIKEEVVNNNSPNISVEPMEVQLRLDLYDSKWVIAVKQGAKEWAHLREDNNGYHAIRKFNSRMEAEEFCRSIGLV
jgi:hypothetical protein